MKLFLALKSVLATYLLFILANQTFSQQPFVHTFGDEDEIQKGKGIVQLNSGTIFLAGEEQLGTEGGNDITLYVLNEQGVEIEKFNYGTEFADYAERLYFHNNQLHIVGFTREDNMYDGLYLRIDTNGTLLEIQNFGSPSTSEVFSDMVLLNNGEKAFCGYVNDPVNGNIDSWIIKTTAANSVVWSYIVNSSLTNSAYAISSSQQGNLYVCGDQLLPSGMVNAYALQLSLSGELNWHTALSTGFNSGCKYAITNSNNQFCIVGESETETSPAFDPTFTRIDSAGNILHQQIIPMEDESDAAFYVMQTGSNQYLLTGYSNTAGNRHALVMSIDSMGTELGSSYYAPFFGNQGYAVAPSNVENGFVMTGFTNNIGNGVLAVFDTVSTITTSIYVEEKPRFSLYPNPVQSGQRINVPLENFSAFLVDTQGKRVHSWEKISRSLSIPLNVKPGIYYLSIITMEQITFHKLLVE